MTLTVTLSDEVAQQVHRWAQYAQKDAAQVVESLIKSQIPSLPHIDTTSISELDDETVLSLSYMKLEAAIDERLGALLTKQREIEMTSWEKIELDELMAYHDRLSVRKSEALVEAVQRGLRPPLNH